MISDDIENMDVQIKEINHNHVRVKRRKKTTVNKQNQMSEVPKNSKRLNENINVQKNDNLLNMDPLQLESQVEVEVKQEPTENYW